MLGYFRGAFLSLPERRVAFDAAAIDGSANEDVRIAWRELGSLSSVLVGALLPPASGAGPLAAVAAPALATLPRAAFEAIATREILQDVSSSLLDGSDIALLAQAFGQQSGSEATTVDTARLCIAVAFPDPALAASVIAIRSRLVSLLHASVDVFALGSDDDFEDFPAPRPAAARRGKLDRATADSFFRNPAAVSALGLLDLNTPLARSASRGGAAAVKEEEAEEKEEEESDLELRLVRRVLQPLGPRRVGLLAACARLVHALDALPQPAGDGSVVLVTDIADALHAIGLLPDVDKALGLHDMHDLDGLDGWEDDAQSLNMSLSTAQMRRIAASVGAVDCRAILHHLRAYAPKDRAVNLADLLQFLAAVTEDLLPFALFRPGGGFAGDLLCNEQRLPWLAHTLLRAETWIAFQSEVEHRQRALRALRDTEAEPPADAALAPAPVPVPAPAAAPVQPQGQRQEKAVAAPLRAPSMQLRRAPSAAATEAVPNPAVSAAVDDTSDSSYTDSQASASSSESSSGSSSSETSYSSSSESAASSDFYDSGSSFDSSQDDSGLDMYGPMHATRQPTEGAAGETLSAYKARSPPAVTPAKRVAFGETTVATHGSPSGSERTASPPASGGASEAVATVAPVRRPPPRMPSALKMQSPKPHPQVRPITGRPIINVYVSRTAAQEMFFMRKSYERIPGDISAGAASFPVTVWVERERTTAAPGLLLPTKLEAPPLPFVGLCVLPAHASMGQKLDLTRKGYEFVQTLWAGAELHGRRAVALDAPLVETDPGFGGSAHLNSLRILDPSGAKIAAATRVVRGLMDDVGRTKGQEHMHAVEQEKEFVTALAFTVAKEKAAVAGVGLHAGSGRRTARDPTIPSVCDALLDIAPPATDDINCHLSVSSSFAKEELIMEGEIVKSHTKWTAAGIWESKDPSAAGSLLHVFKQRETLCLWYEQTIQGPPPDMAKEYDIGEDGLSRRGVGTMFLDIVRAAGFLIPASHNVLASAPGAQIRAEAWFSLGSTTFTEPVITRTAAEPYSASKTNRPNDDGDEWAWPAEDLSSRGLVGSHFPACKGAMIVLPIRLVVSELFRKGGSKVPLEDDPRIDAFRKAIRHDGLKGVLANGHINVSLSLSAPLSQTIAFGEHTVTIGVLHLPLTQLVDEKTFFRLETEDDIANDQADDLQAYIDNETFLEKLRRRLISALSSVKVQSYEWHEMHRPAEESAGSLPLSGDPEATADICLGWAWVPGFDMARLPPEPSNVDDGLPETISEEPASQLSPVKQPTKAPPMRPVTASLRDCNEALAIIAAVKVGLLNAAHAKKALQAVNVADSLPTAVAKSQVSTAASDASLPALFADMDLMTTGMIDGKGLSHVLSRAGLRTEGRIAQSLVRALAFLVYRGSMPVASGSSGSAVPKEESYIEPPERAEMDCLNAMPDEDPSYLSIDYSLLLDLLSLPTAALRSPTPPDDVISAVYSARIRHRLRHHLASRLAGLSETQTNEVPIRAVQVADIRRIFNVLKDLRMVPASYVHTSLSLCSCLTFIDELLMLCRYFSATRLDLNFATGGESVDADVFVFGLTSAFHAFGQYALNRRGSVAYHPLSAEEVHLRNAIRASKAFTSRNLESLLCTASVSLKEAENALSTVTALEALSLFGTKPAEEHLSFDELSQFCMRHFDVHIGPVLRRLIMQSCSVLASSAEEERSGSITSLETGEGRMVLVRTFLSRYVDLTESEYLALLRRVHEFIASGRKTRADFDDNMKMCYMAYAGWSIDVDAPYTVAAGVTSVSTSSSTDAKSFVTLRQFVLASAEAELPLHESEAVALARQFEYPKDAPLSAPRSVHLGSFFQALFPVEKPAERARIAETALQGSLGSTVATTGTVPVSTALSPVKHIQVPPPTAAGDAPARPATPPKGPNAEASLQDRDPAGTLFKGLDPSTILALLLDANPSQRDSIINVVQKSMGGNRTGIPGQAPLLPTPVKPKNDAAAPAAAAYSSSASFSTPISKKLGQQQKEARQGPIAPGSAVSYTKSLSFSMAANTHEIAAEPGTPSTSNNSIKASGVRSPGPKTVIRMDTKKLVEPVESFALQRYRTMGEWICPTCSHFHPGSSGGAVNCSMCDSANPYRAALEGSDRLVIMCPRCSYGNDGSSTICLVCDAVLDTNLVSDKDLPRDLVSKVDSVRFAAPRDSGIKTKLEPVPESPAESVFSGTPRNPNETSAGMTNAVRESPWNGVDIDSPISVAGDRASTYETIGSEPVTTGGLNGQDTWINRNQRPRASYSQGRHWQFSTNATKNGSATATTGPFWPSTSSHLPPRTGGPGRTQIARAATSGVLHPTPGPAIPAGFGGSASMSSGPFMPVTAAGSVAPRVTNLESTYLPNGPASVAPSESRRSSVNTYSSPGWRPEPSTGEVPPLVSPQPWSLSRRESASGPNASAAGPFALAPLRPADPLSSLRMSIESAKGVNVPASVGVEEKQLMGMGIDPVTMMRFQTSDRPYGPYNGERLSDAYGSAGQRTRDEGGLRGPGSLQDSLRSATSRRY
jgi:hypothetical protein